jgi:putative DNA primase/helicase
LSDRLANGQGLLARCLVAWPESTIGTRHTEAFEWAGDRRELKRLFGVLSSLMEAAPRTSDHSEQELDPIELPLSPEATAMALQAGNRFEALMTSGNDLCELRDRTAKALENACRIAGVLVAIEQGMAARQIEADHLGRALVLVQWYLAEALRIRGAAAVPQAVQDAEALSRWLQGRGIAMFRTHAALNAGPAQLRNKARLMAAIEQLVETGYLVANPAGTEVEGVKARKSWRVLHHVV